jgi:phosphatidylglycerophosphatase A
MTFGKLVRKTVASVFFIGYLPASGTFASAAVVAALWFAKDKFEFLRTASAASLPWCWLALLAAVGVSFFFASGSRELFGKEDSGKIVIDEAVGQLITFLFLPLTMPILLTGFFLFRFFDIVKPFPIYHMEALEDGVGVTMDDVVAGIMANASLIILHIVYHAVKGYL